MKIYIFKIARKESIGVDRYSVCIADNEENAWNKFFQRYPGLLDWGKETIMKQVEMHMVDSSGQIEEIEFA